MALTRPAPCVTCAPAGERRRYAAGHASVNAVDGWQG
jgi:hypothetical protein